MIYSADEYNVKPEQSSSENDYNVETEEKVIHEGELYKYS